MAESILDELVAKRPKNEGGADFTPIGEALGQRLLLHALRHMSPERREKYFDADGNIVRRTNEEYVKRQVECYNKSAGRVNEDECYRRIGVYYDCPKCRNRGNFSYAGDDGLEHFRDCDCMKIRESMRYLQISGLAGMVTAYRFDNWQCRQPWQRFMLERALRYSEAPEGWFCLSGTPGTGKTHLCTAVCGRLIERGYYTRYMLWRDFSQKAKALVNDADAYEKLVEPFASARVLYMDDFFKTGRALNRNTGKREPMSPTEADINLAFKIINARYNNPSLLTVISSEMSLEGILETDEATGSRIAERARGWYQDLRDKDPRNRIFLNWRLT